MLFELTRDHTSDAVDDEVEVDVARDEKTEAAVPVLVVVRARAGARAVGRCRSVRPSPRSFATKRDLDVKAAGSSTSDDPVLPSIGRAQPVRA